MLDFNVNMEFKPDVKLTSKNNTDILVVTSCAIHMLSNDDRMYSDFDNETYNELNNATDNLGFIDIEIGFVGYNGKPYPKVYTKCFTLHTDNYQLIKPMKIMNNASESKVNQRGETVIGIRYYFKSKDEIYRLETCDNILLESFFALKKVKNVYGIACQLHKEESQWTARYANTYRPQNAKNIKSLVD